MTEPRSSRAGHPGGLAQVIAEAKAEARAAGLTDAKIDAELRAYNTERRSAAPAPGGGVGFAAGSAQPAAAGDAKTTPAMSGAPSGSLATWLAFVMSPAAPKHAMSVLELEGYLTGVLVTPSLIPPGRWLAGLWGDDEPVFDDAAQIQSVLGAVSSLHNEIGQRIERSLRRLEAEKVCDYRPGFLPQTGKPARDAVIAWVRGFWRAMALAPSDWAALVEDERTQVLMVPLVGFMDTIKDKAFEPAPDIEERLDEAAADLPRSILLLRKIAELRASRADRLAPTRGTKVGRNDPCLCGSGKKFKRCCGSV